MKSEPAQKLSLTTGSIPALIWKIGWPASLGFIFHTLYNVVDTKYAGLLGTHELAALTLSFPAFFLIIAISVGTGTGATALIAAALGRNDITGAQRLLRQSILMGLAIGLALAFLGPVFSRFLLVLSGASPELREATNAYLDPIWYTGFAFMGANIANSGLSAQGNTRPFAIVLALSLLANVALNPALMYGWGPLPALGLAGIGWATAVIETAAFIFLLWRLWITPMGAALYPSWPRPRLWVTVLAQGAPAALAMVMTLIYFAVMNTSFLEFGEEAIAAIGIAQRVEQLILLPVVGVNVAQLAIVGQNFGARNFARIQETWYWSNIYGLGICLFGVLALFFVREPVVAFFDNNPETIRWGVITLTIEMFVVPLWALAFMTNAAHQGMQRPLYAPLVNFFRLALVPAILLLLVTEIWHMGFTLRLWLLAGSQGFFASVLLIYTHRVLQRKRKAQALAVDGGIF